jgi:hypothetical protein
LGAVRSKNLTVRKKARQSADDRPSRRKMSSCMDDILILSAQSATGPTGLIRASSATRSRIAHAVATACGPPPDTPMTAHLCTPSLSASATTSAAMSLREEAWRKSESP